jgi:hypothetical protein
MPPMLQPKHRVSTSNDNPVQINKTQFKPFIEQENQCWSVNNLCLYYGELGHIVGACLKKCVQHVTHDTIPTITQGLEEKGNENVKS